MTTQPQAPPFKLPPPLTPRRRAMADTVCPKCGAARTMPHISASKMFECGSREFVMGDFDESNRCLRNQLAALRSENERVTKERDDGDRVLAAVIREDVFVEENDMPESLDDSWFAWLREGDGDGWYGCTAKVAVLSALDQQEPKNE